MASYHYIALSQDGKELSGIIEAPDDAKARAKLNGLGLSVVSLEVTLEVKSTPEHPTKATFEFTAFDKNRKKVVGTIAAEDGPEAYERLFSQYQLDVTGLSEGGKSLDLTQIQDTYQKLHSTDAGKGAQFLAQTNDSLNDKSNERAELLAKIDYTMVKIENFLRDYLSDLKQDERETIQAYINQLIRIKDSTNLEHIRMTCEKMLEHIQRQELFIHEEQRTKESTHIKVETREMLSSLKRTGLKQDIDPVNILTSLQKNMWLAPFATFLLKFTGIRTPEILKVRDEIKSVNGHMWQYVRLLFGKNSTIRKEAWQTIGTLRAEKRRLQLKMDGLIEQEKSRISPASDGDSSQTSIFKTSTGWIFGLYFLLYLISYPLTVKLLSIHIPPAFYFYHMTLPKYVMIFCFFSYAAAQTRHLFFPRHPWAHIVIYPFTYMTYLLILINLM